MKRLLIGIVVGLLLTLGVTFGAAPRPAYALLNASRGAACGGVDLSETPTTCGEGSSGTLTNLIKRGLGVLSFVAGVAAVIMIILAGIRFVTSQGEGSSTASARNAIIYAIIGLVIVALSQIIVRYVLRRTNEALTPPTSSIELTLNRLDVNNRDMV